MSANFKEKKLPASFCKSTIREAKKLIDLSITFTVVGIPGVGIAIFLYYLSMQKFAFFIHVDINKLPKYNSDELFNVLLEELGGKQDKELSVLESCRQRLEYLAAKHRKVVVIFNRFDALKKHFSKEFFTNLKYLRDVDKGRVVMIFAANSPLYMQAPKAVSGTNIYMFSHSLFLPPYSPADLKSLLKLYTPLFLKHPLLGKAIKLSGGHYQLMNMLLRSEHLLDDPLKDPVIKVQLREFYEYLAFAQRKVLKQLVLGKAVKLADSFLVDCGWIKHQSGRYEIFSPLLAQYVKSMLRVEMPPRETKLFQLLHSRLERVVLKEEIFDKVWEDNQESATDWALDALIYRLRKNPVFAAKYALENRKKVGYVLRLI